MLNTIILLLIGAFLSSCHVNNNSLPPTYVPDETPAIYRISISNSSSNDIYRRFILSHKTQKLEIDGQDNLLFYQENELHQDYDHLKESTYVGHEMRVKKYNSQLQFQWEVIYNNNYKLKSNPNGKIQTDKQGNVYLAGHEYNTSYSTVNNLDFDIVLRKYDVNGNLVWSRFFDSAVGNSFDTLLNIEIDDYGRIFLIGEFEKMPIAIGPDTGIQKTIVLDNDGNELFRIEDAIGKYFAGPVIDRAGNFCLVTGNKIKKYTATGSKLWETQINDLLLYTDLSLKIDAQNNIFVVAHQPDLDITWNIKKWDANGAYLWQSTAGVDIAIVADGSIYTISESELGVLTSKLNTHGQVLWERIQPKQAEHYPILKINVDSKNRVYATFFALDDKLTERSYRTGSWTGTTVYDAQGNILHTINEPNLIINNIKLDSLDNFYLQGFDEGYVNGYSDHFNNISNTDIAGTIIVKHNVDLLPVPQTP